MFPNCARFDLERDFKITLSLYMYEDLNGRGNQNPFTDRALDTGSRRSGALLHNTFHFAFRE
jgi:hypothetical protein